MTTEEISKKQAPMSLPVKNSEDVAQELLADLARCSGALGNMIANIEAHVAAQVKEINAMSPVSRGDHKARMEQADPLYWASMASQQLQIGLMAARRAVEQPVFF